MIGACLGRFEDMTLDSAPGVPQDGARPLTLADFETLTGSSFDIETEFGRQQLVLSKAQELPNAARDEGGFRLEFTGPLEPRLPQSIYVFPVNGTLHDIFIVPIGFAPAGGIRYEAVFF
jgi:hypothetical protein